jgi:carboxylate-amine ligase
MNGAEHFRGNPWPTLGVELELQLVDSNTQALRSAIGDLLPHLDESLVGSVKPEFMQCYVEINSDAGRTVSEVAVDLRRKIQAVEQIADRQGVSLFWGATHPFSRWQEQQITPDERYFKLVDLFQETVVRPVTFGLHVHVGVSSGDRAIQISNRIQRHLPTLLALSANSPFWNSRETQHHAHRIELLEVLPTGGLPPLMSSWADYEKLVARLLAARFIESRRDLWWDARPNAANGTLEVRICDMPPDLPSVLGLSALIQCLVHQTAMDIDGGRAMADPHPLMVRQNRWRACRYGLNAELVDLSTLEAVSARTAVKNLVESLRGTAEMLGCTQYLETALQMSTRRNGSELQRAFYRQTGSLRETVRLLSRKSRITSTTGPLSKAANQDSRAWPAPSATRGKSFRYPLSRS